MKFIINESNVLCLDRNDWPGVIRVAGKVRNDMDMILNDKNELELFDGAPEEYKSGRIYAGCIGKSALIDDLEKKGIIDLSDVRGKREVYLFKVTEVNGNPVIIIAGSDKRGTIYGLFQFAVFVEF